MRTSTWLRQALLCGAAFGALSATAHADELSDLKAQIAALSDQVQAMQQTQSTALPGGVSLITMRKGNGTYDTGITEKTADAVGSNQGYTFAILPTADMPAPATEVTVSAEIRARIFYQNERRDRATFSGVVFTPKTADGPDTSLSNVVVVNGSDKTADWQVSERARVNIQGKTQTTVGEVGARVRFQKSDGSNAFVANKAYGYWKMTPEWTLQAGRDDSLSAVQAGVDWVFTGGLVGNLGGPTDDNVDQFTLRWTSGPLSFAFGVEDARVSDAYSPSNDNLPALAGYSMYSFNEKTNVMVSGLIQRNDVGDSSTDYFAGVGANIGLGSVATFTAAAAIGRGYQPGTYFTLDSTDTKYWEASAGLILATSDVTSIELGYGYTHTDNTGAVSTTTFGALNTGCTATNLSNCNLFTVSSVGTVKQAHDITAEFLWAPVTQLTIGAGVGYELTKGGRVSVDGLTSDNLNSHTWSAGFGGWFRF